MDRIEEHFKILNKLHETYKAKNTDYGGSFSTSFQEFGLVSAIVRMTDKMERIKGLYKNGEAKVSDEKIEDTLLDLANYAIMTIIELGIQKADD